MDNLINILVAVIIIYSFLAPLFKQKKGSGSNPDRSERNPNKPKQKPSYSGMDYDILTEIEEMMNRGKLPPLKTTPLPEASPSTYSGEHQATISEHQSEESGKKGMYDNRKLKISDADRLSLEKSLEIQFTSKRKEYYNPIFARVRSSFTNKADFRNGFIISEILGKPKALRR